MSSGDIDAVTSRLAKASVNQQNVLSFAGRGIKLDKEDDAKEIIDEVNKCQKLTALRLEGNTLGVEAAKAISKALEKHPEFERALWSDMFTGRLKSEIPQALRYLGSAIMLAEAKLVELDLSDNAFGPNGMEGLTELLKSKSCYSLRELRLNNNGLGVTGGKMLAKALLECYKLSKDAGQALALRVFVSGRGRLENEGSMALAEAFKAMGSLEEVSMPQNGINHHGITALALAFAANKNLRILNLNDNTFTEKGAKAMAKALPEMQNLETINFGDCLLRTEGAKSIADAIKDGHQKLRVCNLSFNEITKAGANSVAEAMENKDKLENIELDGNMLGEEGIELVKATLETIEKLDQLGSLSDDEGTEDEGDDDDEEDVPEDEEEGDEVIDPSLQVTGTAITPRSQKHVSAEEFLAFPSPTKLELIGEERATAILKQFGGDTSDTDKAAEMIIKLSSVVTQDDTKTKDAACECSDALLREVYSCTDESIPAKVANSFLVHMGLLKGEEKVKVPGDLNGCLIVMTHLVGRPYFHKTTKDILQVFISRPSKSLDSCGKTKHMLMQALFK